VSGIPHKRGADADRMHRKSQIAIEYAYQVRDQSPTTWVFLGARRYGKQDSRRATGRSLRRRGWMGGTTLKQMFCGLFAIGYATSRTGGG